MWRRIAAGALVLCSYAVATQAGDAGSTPMTQARMESVLRELGSDVSGVPGMIELTFNGIRVGCISDVEHDRMRLIAQVRRVSELSPEQIASVLEANFHTALDARYATSRGTLYAAYIHPLSALSEREIRSAVRQVSGLVRSFGKTYSSGELVYSSPPSL